MNKDSFCNACGNCCRVVPLAKSFEDTSRMYSPDAEFVKANFIPITKEEAEAINPDIFIKRLYNSEREYHKFFYRCKQLSENGKCMIHNNRTKLCIGYPFYDEAKISLDTLIDMDCGYHILTRI